MAEVGAYIGLNINQITVILKQSDIMCLKWESSSDAGFLGLHIVQL